jgi:hypothetical protein
MTAKEIKVEIQKLLDTVPDQVLKELLAYLKEAQSKDESTIMLSSHLSQILREDKEVLQKLAQ